MIPTTSVHIKYNRKKEGSISSPTDFNEAWRILKEHRSPVIGGALADSQRPKLTVIEGDRYSRDL